jgi:hypothetical protein
MAAPATAPEKVQRIKAARPDEAVAVLAQELGVSVRTVKKYRAEGRRERAEVALAAVREVVEDTAPDAIKTLVRTMELAAERLEAEKSAAWVRETRECAIAVLRYPVNPQEKDPLEGVSDAALLEEALRRAGQWRAG